MNMMDQFFSYPDKKGGRNYSQGNRQNQRINIKNEINPIQKVHSRVKSEDEKLKAKKEVYTSQRLSSRRESQNSKNQVITTDAYNKRNERNSATVASNKPITKVINQNYPSKQDQKTKITTQKGLYTSNKNQINAKEIDNNKRLSAGRNSSPNKRPNEITDKTKKAERNPIQVQKVLVTDTANFLKKANNPKVTNQIYKSNNNNYNTNTYIHKNPNSNIATKLAINEIKSKDQKVFSSTMTDFYKNRDNISTITIDDTGKVPKKPYVLHVRKLDRIRSKSRMRIVYTNNMEEKEPIKMDFNHKMLVVKDVTRDFKTISELNSGEKMTHRYSYSSITANIGRREINESGKKSEKQVIVSIRKNEIIKSEKKPFKLNYKDYLKKIAFASDKNQITDKKTEIKTNFKNKNNNNNEENEKIRDRRNVDNYRSNRISRESSNVSQNASQKVWNKNINSTLPITKSEITIVKKRGTYNSSKMGKNIRNVPENSEANYRINASQVINGSTNNNKFQTETKSNQIIYSGKRSNRNIMDEKEGSGSKVIAVKKIISTKTESKNNSGGNSKEGKEKIVTISKIIRKTTSENVFRNRRIEKNNK